MPPVSSSKCRMEPLLSTPRVPVPAVASTSLLTAVQRESPGGPGRRHAAARGAWGGAVAVGLREIHPFPARLGRPRRIHEDIHRTAQPINRPDGTANAAALRPARLLVYEKTFPISPAFCVEHGSPVAPCYFLRTCAYSPCIRVVCVCVCVCVRVCVRVRVCV